VPALGVHAHGCLCDRSHERLPAEVPPTDYKAGRIVVLLREVDDAHFRKPFKCFVWKKTECVCKALLQAVHEAEVVLRGHGDLIRFRSKQRRRSFSREVPVASACEDVRACNCHGVPFCEWL